MKTFTIELRVDDDPEKEAILKETAKTAAKHFFTTACLIYGSKRRPQIKVYGSDFFSGEEEISLADDIDENANSQSQSDAAG